MYEIITFMSVALDGGKSTVSLWAFTLSLDIFSPFIIAPISIYPSGTLRVRSIFIVSLIDGELSGPWTEMCVTVVGLE